MLDGVLQCRAVAELWKHLMTGTVSRNVNVAIHSVSSAGWSHTAQVHVPCGGLGKRSSVMTAKQ